MAVSRADPPIGTGAASPSSPWRRMTRGNPENSPSGWAPTRHGLRSEPLAGLRRPRRGKRPDAFRSAPTASSPKPSWASTVSASARSRGAPPLSRANRRSSCFVPKIRPPRSSPVEALATPAGSRRKRPVTSRPQTLGELKASGYPPRAVKEELRDNLRRALPRGENPFPGILGYEQTVIPAIDNAILSRHDFILLGPARPGEDAPPADRSSSSSTRGSRRSRDASSTRTRSRRSRKYGRRLAAEKGDATADRLDPAGRALPREARDAGRDDRRPDRRHRPDQGRDRAADLLRRRGHPLRHHPAHQPRDLRDQRAAGPAAAHPGRAS